MILEVKAEFRGKSERKNEKGIYRYINLEDENGESAKFQVDDNVDYSVFEKGDKIIAKIDYNTKYGSLKVVGVDCE